MPKQSAGIMLYRRRNSGLEVFLVHPDGPLWAKKDFGTWSIPKGEYFAKEEPVEAAKREFEEETGFALDGNFIEMGDLKQSGGKIVTAWAIEDDCDPQKLKSNTFMMEWPPRSGWQIEVPEVDRGCWYPIKDARRRLLAGQRGFLDRLLERIVSQGSTPGCS